MQVDVLPMFERGRSRPQSERELGPHTRGELRVYERRVHELGRSVRCAKVVSAVDGTATPILPELLDAEVIWVEKNKLRVRGNELIGGSLFGQTWDLKVV